MLTKCLEAWLAHSKCPLRAGYGGCGCRVAWRWTLTYWRPMKGDWQWHNLVMLLIFKYHLRASVSMCVGGGRDQSCVFVASLTSPFPVFPCIIPVPPPVLSHHLSARRPFLIVFYTLCFSHTTELPQAVRACVLLLLPCQGQEQCPTPAHTERETCLLDSFERFARELP